MLGGFAMAAGPAQANFNLNLACGNSYAVEIHGTEPALTNDSVLHYIAGVGQITFGPKPDNNIGTGCPIVSGEMIYSDNDVLTYSAGPATCYAASSLLGGGIPCFNGVGGGITGSLVSGPDGGKVISMVLHEGWLNGAPTPSTLPLSFTIQGSGGDIWMLGNSVPDLGPTPTSPPPGSPALTIQMQKQSSSISLPVTGPGDQTGSLIFPQFSPPAPLGLTGGGGNGFGVAPYLGLSVSLFQGFGAPSTDLFAQPVTGSFGSTISSLQIFPNGQAGGSASFSTNDNVGNTTGATNDDCDTIVTQTGNFADGASNVAAAFPHPSLTCTDGAGNATFELSSVLWGTIDQNEYSIVTGLSAQTLTSGGIIPAGLMSNATGLSSAPAGVVVNLVFTSITSVNGHTATFPFVEFFSDTPAGCDVSINMPSVTTGSGNTLCHLELENLSNVATNPVLAVVPGDAFPFSKYAFESCTCNGTSGGSATSTLTITSPDCPLSGNTIYDGGSPTPPHGPVVTCKN